MKNKKLLATLLIGTTLISCLLSGCGKTNDFNNMTLKDETFNISIDVSKLSEEDAIQKVTDAVKNKTLDIIVNEKVVDSIKYGDLDLTYNIEDEVNKIKEVSNKDTTELNIHITASVTFDYLKSFIKDLNCIKNPIKSEDAYVKEDENGEKIIVPEVYGTELEEEKFLELLKQAIENGQDTLNLDEAKIYIKPKKTTETKELIQDSETYNEKINMQVEYVFGDKTEIITKEQLGEWISYSETKKILFDEEPMRKYITSLAQKYNNYGKAKSFKNHKGDIITISATDYGWSIDIEKELAKLKSDIKKGHDVSREPVWENVGYGDYIADDGSGNSIGNTYVEANIEEQHIYVYIDGKMVSDCDMISGDTTHYGSTPKGVYIIEDKERNREELACTKNYDYGIVNYWMPFSGDLGIHDTSWIEKFGGDIYKTNGSSGCLNISVDDAQDIYNNVEKGYPVVIY